MRSTPFSSLVCFGLILSGWILARNSLSELSENLDGTGLELLQKVITFVDNISGWLTLVVVFNVLLVSTLLSGWTKTAVFKALKTGILNYEEGSDASCKCNPSLVKCFSYGYLFLITLLAQLLWISALTGALGSFEYLFIVDLTAASCQSDSRQDELYSFFDVVTDPCTLRLVKTKNDAVDVNKYCNMREIIFQEILLVFIGFLTMTAGQVFLSNVMIRNCMVARSELLEMDDCRETSDNRACDTVLLQPSSSENSNGEVESTNLQHE